MRVVFGEGDGAACVRLKRDGVNAAKLSTRRELYRRLERARSFLHAHDDRNVTLGELAVAFNTMTRGLREREGLKLTLALSETLELEGVLNRLVDSLARAVRFEEAAVLIKTRDGMNMLVTRGSRGKEEARRLVPYMSCTAGGW